MEKVKKALEKAKELRKTTETRDANAFTKLGKVKVGDIAYQQTKVIAVSEATFKKNRVVAALKHDSNADLFKILRAKIIQRMRATGANVLAITSPTQGVGKSLIASNLAVSIAMDANYSVLLADFDFRRPNIHKYFGIAPDFGINDYFENNKTIPELLIHPSLESLVILPAGKSIRESSELLSSPKMQELASELKNRYSDRIVIIDLPPLLQTDDAMVFMPNVDACVLVVGEGESSKEDVTRSLQLIDETKYIGTILNKSNDKQSDQYY